jgi:hypothetical protein
LARRDGREEKIPELEIVSVEEKRRDEVKITVLDGKEESRRRVPHQQAVAG